MKKPVNKLIPADLLKQRVWQFTGDDEPDETYVTPVGELPIVDAEGCIVGCELKFANGTLAAGFLGNLNLHDWRLNDLFKTLTVFDPQGRQFFLARYWDVGSGTRTPVALAKVFGMPVDAVFPIAYDISDVVKGSDECVKGVIEKEPKEKLSRAEIIRLAVP